MDMPTLLSVLDDHGFADISTTRKVAMINDTYWDVCSREAWPFLEKSANLTFDGTNPNPSNYPTDVGQVKDIIDTLNGFKVNWVSNNEVRDAFPILISSSKGIAFYYYFIANQLNFFPIPLSSQTMTMLYEAVPVALTATSLETDILIPARWHSVLYTGALAQLYDMEDDPELSVKFETRFEKKLELLRYQAFRRQIDVNDTIQITDYEDLFD